MDIKFYGQACFSLTEGGVTVITDPFQEEIGIKMPSLKADAVTVSHNAPGHNNVRAVEGDPKLFSWPGEYETKGIHFKMIPASHPSRPSGSSDPSKTSGSGDKDDEEQLENNIVVIHWSGMSICHLGAQGTKLTSEQLEQIGDVDILFVPVGGKGCLDAKRAKDVIEQMEPRLIIPMCYDTEGSNVGLAPLSAFLSVMGTKVEEAVDSFKVKRSDLPEDTSKMVVLNVAS